VKQFHKIKVVAFAKFQGMVAGLVGLVCGIFYAFGGLIVDILVSAGILSAEAMATPGLSIGTLLAFIDLIGMPIIFVIVGFLLGIVEVLLFNIVAGWFGDINLDFKK